MIFVRISRIPVMLEWYLISSITKDYLVLNTPVSSKCDISLLYIHADILQTTLFSDQIFPGLFCYSDHM